MAKKRNAADATSRHKTSRDKTSRQEASRQEASRQETWRDKTSSHQAKPATPGARATTGAVAAEGDDRSSGAGDVPLAPPDERIVASELTLHQLFAQQSARMLERADLSEEQKQSLLIGMSCPCCGAGGFSFTAKLRRD